MISLDEAGPMSGVEKLIVGCGYLGQRVARAWLARGDRVYGLVQSENRAQQLRDAGIIPLVADVTQPDTLPRFPDVQTVLYCIATPRRSSPSDATKRSVYVVGLQNVLSRLPWGYERFIYISSTSVYGQSGGEWVGERSPCQPKSPGGRICLESEQTLRRFFQNPGRAGPAVNLLRLSGLYGPGRLRSRIEHIRSGRPLDSAPDAWLNLIHVDDAVRA
ncbi:MAG TPA: NAD-dependent epimerase/dehydratase family protein, partial [Planctomycetaceae bacterium]|nr:NAD-dependent epimerase/dehydratase family protein [Planctomycetaceae bacterium]